MRTMISTILAAAACVALTTPTPALAQHRGGGGHAGGGHGGGHSGWNGGGHSGWHGGAWRGPGVGHGGNWHGGHHWRGGYGHHWRGGFGVGFYLGPSWYWGPSYAPVWYDYPVVQYAPVYAPAHAPAYVVEGSGPATVPPDYVAPPAGTVQYYCPSGGYYPTVAACPQGWLRVVPR